MQGQVIFDAYTAALYMFDSTIRDEGLVHALAESGTVLRNCAGKGTPAARTG
jgi:hypothetical protein